MADIVKPIDAQRVSETATTLLKVWSELSGLTFAGISLLDCSAKERMQYGIPVYLLREDFSLSVEAIAEKIGLPEAQVRLLSIEMNRHLHSWKHAAVRVEITRIRTGLSASLHSRVRVEPKPPAPVIPEQKLPKKKPVERTCTPVPKGESRQIPADVVDIAVLRAAHCFGIPAEHVRGRGQERTNAAMTARRAAMVMLHRVVAPEVDGKSIAALFDMPCDAVKVALERIDVLLHADHQYRGCLQEYCELYNVPLDVLLKTRGELQPVAPT